MTDRLSIYNGAMTVHLGEPPLDTLDDDVPARYALDDVWTRDGVETCLQMGQWNYATRVVRLEFAPSITPEFGYQRAFEKPSDFVRTVAVCSDEYYKFPLREYDDKASHWWCDIDQLFVKYVSDDALYGLDFAQWPKNFTRWAESWFALQVCNLTTFSDKYDKVEKAERKLLLRAQSTDAMEQAPKTMPTGSWSRARNSGAASDIGSRSRLVG